MGRDQHKGHSRQKAREKWTREHPGIGRKEFARLKKEKRKQKEIDKK